MIPLTTAFLDIETVLKFRMNSVKDDIRNKVGKVIDSLSGEKNKKVTKKRNNEFDLIKNLKNKNCYYVKADKGNKLVIIEKADYDRRMLNLINECAYKKVKNTPLPKMIRESDSLRQKIGKVFGVRLARNLKVSNPKDARIHGLPKLHKAGNKMRPIVSSIGTTDYLIAKWLVGEVKKLPPFVSFSVKNSFDFAEKIENVVVNSDETKISFDVCSLFPSIPIDVALREFEKYLEPIDIPFEHKSIYYQAARMCMDHSYFQFRDSIYQVTTGTNMGNPLSPLISELFTSAFERKLEEENLLPRIWLRYVDDVFAIVKKNEIDSVLNVLYNRFDTIKFTCENENDECKISFLDMELSTSVYNKIDIGIYHKPTDTMRTITSDSNCSMQHKLAAYHSMVHRLCRMKLSAQNYMTEYNRIKEMAKINGFRGDLVDVLIKKHLDKINKFNLSTLFSQNSPEVEKTRVALPYVPQIMNKIKNKFREYNLDIVYTKQDNEFVGIDQRHNRLFT